MLLVLWFELNCGFKYFYWCWVCGGVGVFGFIEDGSDFRYGFDKMVGLLEYLSSFIGR